MKEIVQKLKEYTSRRKNKTERIKKDVGKEDFLLNQIDEFREKAKQLQELLSSKADKVQELQDIVAEKEDKAKELTGIIEERQDAADRVVAGVKEQIDEMIRKVDEKLNELNATFTDRLAENADNSAAQHEEVRNLIREYSEKLSETVNGLNGQFEKTKSEICEKVHTENVNCYRNVQTLIEESNRKLDGMEESISRISSFKTFLMIIVIFAVLNCVGLAVIVARIMGFM